MEAVNNQTKHHRNRADKHQQRLPSLLKMLTMTYRSELRSKK